MKFSVQSGLVALALTGAALSPAAAQSVSAGVGNPIKASVRLANAGNTSAAIAEVNRARSAAGNAVERRKVGEAAAYVYTRAGQWGAAAKELQNIGAGPRQLAPYYYRAGDYGKAIELAKRGGGSDMDVIIAQSYSKQGNEAGAAEIYKRLVKAGGPRQVDYLQNLASIQYRLKDRVGYLETTRSLIKADPSPTRWLALLTGLKQQNMGNGPKLAVYELLRQTGNLTKADDVQDAAKFAVLSGHPMVAVSAMNEAANANVVDKNDAMIQRLFQVSQQNAQTAAAQAQSKGPLAMANVLFGRGQYPQAAGLYERVAQSDPAKADEARLFGGIALVRAGNSDGAQALLRGVGDKSAYKDVAELWALYAQTRAA